MQTVTKIQLYICKFNIYSNLEMPHLLSKVLKYDNRNYTNIFIFFPVKLSCGLSLTVETEIWASYWYLKTTVLIYHQIHELMN